MPLHTLLASNGVLLSLQWLNLISFPATLSTLGWVDKWIDLGLLGSFFNFRFMPFISKPGFRHNSNHTNLSSPISEVVPSINLTISCVGNKHHPSIHPSISPSIPLATASRSKSESFSSECLRQYMRSRSRGYANQRSLWKKSESTNQPTNQRARERLFHNWGRISLDVVRHSRIASNCEGHSKWEPNLEQQLSQASNAKPNSHYYPCWLSISKGKG